MEPTYDELRRENQGLRGENDRPRQENQRLSRRVAEMDGQVQRLTQRLEESRLFRFQVQTKGNDRELRKSVLGLASRKLLNGPNF